MSIKLYKNNPQNIKFNHNSLIQISFKVIDKTKINIIDLFKNLLEHDDLDKFIFYPYAPGAGAFIYNKNTDKWSPDINEFKINIDNFYLNSYFFKIFTKKYEDNSQRSYIIFELSGLEIIYIHTTIYNGLNRFTWPFIDTFLNDILYHNLEESFEYINGFFKEDSRTVSKLVLKNQLDDLKHKLKLISGNGYNLKLKNCK